MRFFGFRTLSLILSFAFALGLTVLTLQQTANSQETTGGLQGTIKDPSGAVVPKAKVVITGTTLMGSKDLVTDSSGYYRFANLPPGTYAITVSAEGFKTAKRDGLVIGVGHLPTVDVALQVGAAATTVEVTGAAPVIDTTTTENMTNINSQSLQNLPTGTSFQSVIQFAPMARNEPLAGYSINGRGSGGTGGGLPGSSGNGNSFGYSIGGAADSETSYLVEGQDTENISGGYSKANVPMDFIDEVEMKTSGISAEYGGALGGVVNVVMKKGGNSFHGEMFSTYESSGTDANPTNAFLRYDPTDLGNAGLGLDPAYQIYASQKDHFRYAQPGIVVGGPIYKDRVWFFAGFDPSLASIGRTVDFGSQDGNAGLQYFTRDTQTWYGTSRIDAQLTKRIRVYGSWLYQYARRTGASMPTADPISGESSYVNSSIYSPLSTYSHGLGWSAPNGTYNVGADITLTQKLVSTTRYGYFFENYHDFGWPTSSPDIDWGVSSLGALSNFSSTVATTALPTELQQVSGTSTTPYNQSYTYVNADKHYQFNQDFAFFKGGWWGTHNFKFGYQLNHLTNLISQNGNVPFAEMVPGQHSHSPLTVTGITNCALLKSEWGYLKAGVNTPVCAGEYGYMEVVDFATVLSQPAADTNHALYVQDSWNVGKGLTFQAGLRVEKEALPAPAGYNVKAIDFAWSDKIEPRLGVAWDPTGKGKMKLFGSYGVVNDVMKLLLAQTSWGAQAYEICWYPLGPDGIAGGDGYSNSDITLTFKNGRACPSGPASTGANFVNGVTPPSLVDSATNVSIIENVNERPWEPVAPGVKPYRQHEFVVGWDYQISPNLAFEARYDRRRLDHVIEDASLSDVNFGETYAVVNPGEGVNSTLDGYATYLAGLGEAFGVPGWSFDLPDFGTCASCPAMPKAVRNYDGLELRVTMAPIKRFSGMFSYTYSSLWGNYTGLTTTDQTDGGITGRDSPDTTRAFDEPFYYFGANGKSNNGPLPTDRPNVIKGYVNYTLPWWKHEKTTVGLFQTAYQGTPISSYIDLLEAYSGEPYEATYIYGRGKWVDMTTDAFGNITLGNPRTFRTPWYSQSDFDVKQEISTGEHQSIAFEANAANLWNQHSVTSYWAGMNSLNFNTSLNPGPATLASGASLYQELETGYNPQTWINAAGSANIKNSQYGKPYLFQNGRTIRLAVRFTF